MDNSSTQGFEKLLNFRDVGQSINDYLGSKKLKTGLFYRSARPDEATPRDRTRLVDSYKIHTIIDLRTKSEHIQQAQKRNTTPIVSAEPLTPSNNTAATPLKIPSVTYAEINFNGSAYSWALIKQLPYLSTCKLLALMAAGYRTQAISILGTQVMAPRGLVGLAEDSIDHCTAEVNQVFNIYASKSCYPVLVHCTQGKDRTGLVVLLVLMLLLLSHNHGKEDFGQEDERRRRVLDAIAKDYRLSQQELLPEREERLGEIRSIGLPDDFADCPHDWIDKVAAYIETKYGGVEKYLSGACGVGKEMQDRVKEVLLA